MKRVIIGVLINLLFGWTLASAQDNRAVADEYFRKGDFDKAYALYQKLVRSNSEKEVLDKYVASSVRLKKTDESEKVLKRMVRSEEKNAYLWLQLGLIEETRRDSVKAAEHFAKAINVSASSLDKLSTIAQDFAAKDKPDWSVRALLKARNEAREPALYAGELARLYGALGQKEAMIDELLRWGLAPTNREQVQAMLQDNLRENEQRLLESVLYRKVQESPGEMFYTEMLVWYLSQRKEFNRAFVQERALDRRMKLGGIRVYDLASIALQNKDYKSAASMFDYIVKEYPQGQLYPIARRLAIKSREEQIKNTYPVEEAEIRKLIADYHRLLLELGQNTRTLEALRSTATLYAFHLNEKDSAIAILNQAMKVGTTDRNFVDRCKLDLGDIYLLKGEPWESTLLYMQVEKSQKEETLGYDAKLRNARLHYFKGDFELAKEILDILKMATSREIANDANSLSLLIMDNTGLDSTETAMKEYAAIELMIFQNKVNEATEGLSGLYEKYRSHSLADEILWLRANMLFKQNRIDEGLQDLQKITSDYSTDVLGDDALYLTAKMLEENKKDKAQAMELYNQLLQKYPGSILGADARKRFRALRGDTIN